MAGRGAGGGGVGVKPLGFLVFFPGCGSGAWDRGKKSDGSFVLPASPNLQKTADIVGRYLITRHLPRAAVPEETHNGTEPN